MDPGSVSASASQGQDCPSPGVAERGEVSGCSNSGLPPVPGTPSQHSGQSSLLT